MDYRSSFTKTNQLMNKSLRDLADDKSESSPVKVDLGQLTWLLTADLAMREGCVLWWHSELGVPDPDASFIPDPQFVDQTGYECFQNHLHARDFLHPDRPKNSMDLLRLGLAMAAIIRLRLKTEFPRVPFAIYVAFNVKPFDDEDPNEWENLRDCTVRFHVIREGEVWSGPLEDFRYKAVGIMELQRNTSP